MAAETDRRERGGRGQLPYLGLRFGPATGACPHGFCVGERPRRPHKRKRGDFAGFLSLLAGWEVPIPDGGWQRAGIVTPAPGCYGVAWRVLDAQYTRVPEFPGAVPQRRRRVILVGHLGSWEYPAKVLFDGEMCGGTDAPRREAGQGSAEDTQGRAPRAHTVRMRAGKPGGGKGALVSEELSLTLQTGNDQTLFQFPCWWDGSQQSATITASSDHQFMPDKQQLQSVIDMRQIDTGDGVFPTLLSTDYKGGKAICDEVCPTLDANYPAKMNRQDAGKLVQEVYAFDSMASHAMNSPNPKSGIHRIDVSRTLDTLDPSPSKNQGVMAIVEEKTLGFIKNDAGGTDTKGEDVFPTIRAGGRGGESQPVSGRSRSSRMAEGPPCGWNGRLHADGRGASMRMGCGDGVRFFSLLTR